MMKLSSPYSDVIRRDDIIRLFLSTFTVSEGVEEGEVIANLVTNIFATVAKDDLYVFSALDDDALVGAIVFTRMTYSQEGRTVFILSPVAVAPTHQGKGVGQALINHGLNGLRENGVDVALTYGDINFYRKVGFHQIGEDVAVSPLLLTYPQGWLGQSLRSKSLVPLAGASTCVDALNDQTLW